MEAPAKTIQKQVRSNKKYTQMHNFPPCARHAYAHAQIRHFGNEARLANSANYFAGNSAQAGCTRQKEPESGYQMHFQMC